MKSPHVLDMTMSAYTRPPCRRHDDSVHTKSFYTRHDGFSHTHKDPRQSSNALDLMDSVHVKPWCLLIMSFSTCPQPSHIYEARRSRHMLGPVDLSLHTPSPDAPSMTVSLDSSLQHVPNTQVFMHAEPPGVSQACQSALHGKPTGAHAKPSGTYQAGPFLRVLSARAYTWVCQSPRTLISQEHTGRTDPVCAQVPKRRRACRSL